jgi:hypothetical protein
MSGARRQLRAQNISGFVNTASLLFRYLYGKGSVCMYALRPLSLRRGSEARGNLILKLKGSVILRESRPVTDMPLT